MNGQDEMNDPVLPDAQGEPEKSNDRSKTVWYIAGGCVLLIIIAVCVGLAIYFGLSIFGGGDPIASVTPKDSLMYINLDLTKAQSDNFNNILKVFQEIAETEEPQDSTEAADDFLGEEYGLNFVDDVLPWIGRHGSFVISNIDLTSEDIEYMLIVETRSRSKADDFVTKLITAVEEKEGGSFETSEKDKATLYTYKSAVPGSEDIVIARVGKFVYFSNSDDAILGSASLKKADSLASDPNYKNALSALSKDRLATIYVGAESYIELLKDMAGSDLFYGNSTSFPDLSEYGMGGIAIGASFEDVGVRIDFAVAYDESNMGDFQKEMLSTVYLEPNGDDLVPENTFFFLDANTSQNFGMYFQEDSPLYDQDMMESFDLLEKEYGISVPELFDLLSGEFVIAVGPADDGLPVELGETNVGFTILASTDDEEGFNAWFANLLDVASQDMYVEYEVNNVTFGDYTLQEVSIQDFGEKYTALYYGADNGFFFLGTSHGILEDGLVSKNTLATNTPYQETWKAFPSGSIPYMYFDMLGLVDLMKNNEAYSSMSDLDTMEKNLKKIPVVALAVNEPADHVQSQTLIIFVDQGE